MNPEGDRTQIPRIHEARKDRSPAGGRRTRSTRIHKERKNSEVEKEKGAGAKQQKLVGDGCLTPCLQLLSRCREERESHWLDLHLSLVQVGN